MFDFRDDPGPNNVDRNIPGLGTIDLVVVVPCGSQDSFEMLERAIDLMREIIAYLESCEVTKVSKGDLQRFDLALVLVGTDQELDQLKHHALNQGVQNIIPVRTHRLFDLGKELRSLRGHPTVVEGEVYVLLVPEAMLCHVEKNIRAAMPWESGLRCSILGTAQSA